MAIDGYYDISQFSNILSTSFINNIIALENGETTAESIINTYGTHAVLAAYFGGKITCNSHIRNTSTKWTAEMALEYESKISTALSSLLSAGNSTSASLSAQLEIANGTSEEHFTATAIGGDGFPALSLQDYLANYSAWVSSMNNITVEKSVIIKLPKNSLVAIWDLLPSQYSKAKTLLQNYFDNAVEHCNSEFLSQFERHYNEPIPDVDYGNTTDYAGGHGTLESPYLISNALHLKNVNKDLSAHYKLINDINLTVDWAPLGLSENGSYSLFKGVFDGDGYAIKGLKRTSSPSYDSSRHAYCGLFSRLEGATVKNVKLTNLEFVFGVASANRDDFYMFVGGIAGKATKSNLMNCGVEGKIQVGNNVDARRNMHVGGLIGEVVENTTIKHCYNKAFLKVRHQVSYVGGIVGVVSGNNVTVKYSYNIGNIDVSTGWWIGGFTGTGGGIVGRVCDNKIVTVTNCYTKCDIKVTNGYYRDIGGIIATATDGGHYTSVNDNVFCIRVEFDENNDYNDNRKKEIWNIDKPGTQVSETQLKAGNEIGALKRYTDSDFQQNEAYCWVYQAGELPKLYWE